VRDVRKLDVRSHTAGICTWGGGVAERILWWRQLETRQSTSLLS
jgi:hypothetical protein